MDDLISRQWLIKQLETEKEYRSNRGEIGAEKGLCYALEIVDDMPSATMYGYNIEHLAYIARVMEKEGVTAECAVRTFDDMGRAVKMILDEIQEKVERSMKDMSSIMELGENVKRGDRVE